MRGRLRSVLADELYASVARDGTGCDTCCLKRMSNMRGWNQNKVESVEQIV